MSIISSSIDTSSTLIWNYNVACCQTDDRTLSEILANAPNLNRAARITLNLPQVVNAQHVYKVPEPFV